MGIPEQIARAEQRLATLEARFSELNRLIHLDGNVTANELLSLTNRESQINALKARIDELNISQGEVNFGENEGAVIEVDNREETGGILYFTDEDFKGAYRQSIIDWTQNSAIDLTTLTGVLQEPDSPSGIGVGDLLAIMTLIFPEAKMVTAVATLIPIAITAFDQGVRASRADTPSLNEILKAWEDAISAFRGADFNLHYTQFVNQWKAEHGLGPDDVRIGKNIFLPDCRNFASNYLPGSRTIERAFVGVALQATPDGYDLDNTSGDAEIDLTLTSDGRWGDPSGRLDDVSENFMNALTGANGLEPIFSVRTKVIDMPVIINFTIRSSRGENMCEIQRRSRVAGNTGFIYMEGNRGVFDAFMTRRAYNLAKLGHLTYDHIG